MAEYTYKDIIIDPTSEEAKNAIGKKCYMYDSPTMLLKMANSNDGARTLESIDESDYPFNDKEFGSEWTCIIVKKEDQKPKYVPFETLDEFIESYKEVEERINYSNAEDYIASCGIWLKDKTSKAYYMVTKIWDIGNDSDEISWKELLEYYTFLDGSPCGKEVEDE